MPRCATAAPAIDTRMASPRRVRPRRLALAIIVASVASAAVAVAQPAPTPAPTAAPAAAPTDIPAGAARTPTPPADPAAAPTAAPAPAPAPAPTAAPAPPADPTAPLPGSIMRRPEHLYARPSGFWTSNRPARGGAYRYRMLAVGVGVLGVAVFFLARMLRRVSRDRALHGA
jgi:hypothetical protein